MPIRFLLAFVLLFLAMALNGFSGGGTLLCFAGFFGLIFSGGVK